jgi:hypothetical protein
MQTCLSGQDVTIIKGTEFRLVGSWDIEKGFPQNPKEGDAYIIHITSHVPPYQGGDWIVFQHGEWKHITTGIFDIFDDKFNSYEVMARAFLENINAAMRNYEAELEKRLQEKEDAIMCELNKRMIEVDKKLEELKWLVTVKQTEFAKHLFMNQ